MKKAMLSLLMIILAVAAAMAPQAKAADELKIWVNVGMETDWLEKVAIDYQQKTGTKIVVESISELAQAQKLSLDGPAGKGADIVCWPHDKIGKTVEQGLIEPISKYLPSGYAEEHFLPKAVQALTYKGQLYGLPFSYQSLALIYNKDKFSKVPATFDQFIEQAKKMTNNNQNKYGFLLKMKDFYFTAPFLQGFGGYVFGQNSDGSYDVSDLGLNTEGGIKGVKYLRRFKTEGLIPKGTTGNTVNGLFMEGNCGAVMNGPWVISDYQEAGIDVGVVPLPKLPNGKRPKTFIGVKGYYVSTFSQHKQAAANFIKYLTDAKRSMDHYQSNNIIVPHKQVANSDQMKNDQLLNGFLQQAQAGVPMPNNPEMSQVWNPAKNAITFVLNGRAKPQRAMKMAEKMITEGIQMMNR